MANSAKERSGSGGGVNGRKDGGAAGAGGDKEGETLDWGDTSLAARPPLNSLFAHQPTTPSPLSQVVTRDPAPAAVDGDV